MPLDPKIAEHIQEHHRDIQAGGARAAVFGVSDGLVTNVSLILGMAGANATPGIVRLAGIAGLIAGAVSMGAGEFISMRAQKELFERELDLEAIEHERHPEEEQDELSQIYESRGMDHDLATRLAAEMSRNPDLALETHAREELGVDPNSLGNPVEATIASFFGFSLGAFLPLIPWLLAKGHAVRTLSTESVVIGILASLSIGALLAYFTGRSYARSALRSLAISTLAAGVTFGVGKLVGAGPVG